MNELFNPTQAAAFTGQSVSTMAKRRIYGTGPEFLKIGSRIFYERAALQAWLDQRRHGSTSEYTTSDEAA